MDRHARWAGLLVTAIVAVVTIAALRWPPASTLLGSLEPDPRHPLMADFSLHYAPAAARALRGETPSAGFQYPPFAVVALTPLEWLPTPVLARSAWALVLALSAGAIAMAPLPRSSPAARWLLAGLLLTSVPLWHSIRWGQISLPVTALSIWGSAGMATRVRGWPLGVAIALKVYPAILLPVLAGWREQARTGLTAIATGAVCGVLIPVVVLGTDGMLEWTWSAIATLRETTRGFMRLNSNAQYLPDVLARWLGPGGRPAFALLSAVLGLWVLVRAVAVCRSGRPLRGLATAWLAIPMLVPPSWPHYFVYMPWVAAVLASERPAAGGQWSAQTTVGLVLGGILASLAGLVLSGGWPVYAHAAFLLSADALFVTVALGSSPRTRRS